MARIVNEQESLGWDHQLFRLTREVFNRNEKLTQEGGFIFDFVARGYVARSMMTLRRAWDKQNGTESFLNLLRDVEKHHYVLNVERFRRVWRKSQPNDENHWIDRHFDGWTADGSTLDPSIVRKDREDLQTALKKATKVAETEFAHSAPQRSATASQPLTFAEMHDAVERLRQTIHRYRGLLTASSGTWEPLAQFDLLRPFMYPWLASDVDRNELMQSISHNPHDDLS